MRFVAVCCLFIAVGTLAAEAGSQELGQRNPFLTLLEQKRGFAVNEEQEAQVPLFLQAVFIWPDKKIALINGQILKEGETVGNYRIVSIEDQGVIVESGAGRTLLNLPMPQDKNLEYEK